MNSVKAASLVPRNARLGLKRRFKKELKQYDLYLMALPLIAFYAIFCYWPMYGLQIVFRDYNPALGFQGSPFVGMKHFINFFSLPISGQYIWNTLRISITSLLVSFPIAILLAIMINSLTGSRPKKLVQTVLYIPHFVSTVIIVGMLTVFLNPTSGLVNQLTALFGLPPKDFMNTASAFLPVYIVSGLWQNAGWDTIIYIGALTSVNPELYEAATIDGATKLQKIRYLELPVIAAIATIMLILNVGGIMSVGWEKAFLMQTPLNTVYSEIISTYTYKTGVINSQFSYAAAIGLFNSVVNFALLIIANLISKRVSGNSLW